MIARPASKSARSWRRRIFSPTGFTLVGLLLFLAFSSALPLGKLLARGATADAFGWVLENSQSLRALGNTVRVSLAAALLATGFGTLLSLLLERFRVPGGPVLRLTIMLPLVIPPHILALAWLSWLGQAGYLSRLVANVLGLERVPWSLYGEPGIVLLLTVFALPVAYLTVSAGLKRLPGNVYEAAQLEGASSWQITRHIVLPLLRPHLLAALMLTFLAGAGNFGITALLGIPGRFITLPTLIYQRVTSFASGGLGQAGALAILLGLAATVALLVQYRLNRDSTHFETNLDQFHKLPLSGTWRWLAVLAWLAALLMAVGPFLALVLNSFMRTYGLPLELASFDLRHYRFVLTELQSFPRALGNSLLLATVASAVTAGLATLLGYVLLRLKRAAWALQLLVDLPYALPGIVFGLSMILAWLPSPLPFVRVYGTLWLLGIAYVGHYLAFALQPIQAAWRQLDPKLEEAAQLDGANLLQSIRWVLFPMLAPTVLVATLLVFLNAVSEISLSALLAGSGTETLGWLIFGLEQAGTGQQAAALSVILLLILGVAGLLAYGLGRWRVRRAA